MTVCVDSHVRRAGPGRGTGPRTRRSRRSSRSRRPGPAGCRRQREVLRDRCRAAAHDVRDEAAGDAAARAAGRRRRDELALRRAQRGGRRDGALAVHRAGVAREVDGRDGRSRQRDDERDAARRPSPATASCASSDTSSSDRAPGAARSVAAQATPLGALVARSRSGGEDVGPAPSLSQMARSATIHVCSACGHSTARWHGQCPGCEAWNTLVEERAAAPRARRAARGGGGARADVAPGRPGPARRRQHASASRACAPAIGELDRVLGGGLVPGSLVLLGGSPGIGKSTLTNMALGNLAAAGRRTLYVSGEESAAQIRLRAERLTPDRRRARGPGARRDRPRHGARDAATPSAPRSASSTRCRRCTAPTSAARPARSARCARSPARIMQVAKADGIAVLLVGHVTKEGALAGPRVLEHLVDCVLQFEGERERTYRTLRALKNRFGSTNEAGVFEMRQSGLVEVLDASARFVARGDRQARLGRARRDGGHAAAARRGAGARLAVASSCRRGASSTASIATASRSCSRCSAATRASASAARTCSSTSSAACASTSPAPTSRSRSRSPARRAASRSARGKRRWRASASSG